MSMLDAALAYAADGYRVHPLKPGTKVPIVSEWQHKATTDRKTIRRWWRDRPSANVGIATGAASDLWVLDVDLGSHPEEAQATMAELVERFGPLKPTRVVKTPSGGVHYWYRYPKNIGTWTNAGGNLIKPKGGIDVRAEGGQVAVAPSIITHDNKGIEYPGGPRAYVSDGAKVAKLPRWLAELTKSPLELTASLTPPAQLSDLSERDKVRVAAYVTTTTDAIADELERLKTDPSSQWDNEVFARAQRLVELARQAWSALTLEEVRDLVLEHAPRDKGFTEARILAKIASAVKRPTATLPLPFEPEPVVVTLPLEEVPEGIDLIDELMKFTGRFVSYPGDDEHVAHCLWILHTHLVTSFDNSPRLAILSPEPGSGKSRCLEVTAGLVARPMNTMTSSTAYIVRKIAATPDEPPTLLLDEVDTVFGVRNDPAKEELRGVLNSGHRRGAKTGRVVTRGREFTPEEFPAFCAVALAGLGDLPDTLMTRAVVIRMRRRKTGEEVEEYRIRQVEPEAAIFNRKIAAWAASVAERFDGDDFPMMPEEIADRDSDNWEPLLWIADVLGGEWPQVARDTAVALVVKAHDRPASLGVQFLTDVRKVFGERRSMRATDLLGELIALPEAPWANLNHEPIDSRFIGKMLARYNIAGSSNIRIDGAIVKGLWRRDFIDAFERYLPELPPTYDQFRDQPVPSKKEK